MIYKCENCVSRNDCHENKSQYKTLSKAVESILKLDEETEFHCWFSCNLKCDYFELDNATFPNDSETCGGCANG